MDASRRRLLLALSVAAGGGALTGGGVSALLTDRGVTSASLATGTVDLSVEYWLDVADGVDLAAPDGVVDGPRIAVPAPTLETDGSATTLLRFALPQGTVPNNPAALWLRSDCPTGTTLGELLQVRLSYADAEGTPLATIESGSLRAVANALREGVRLLADGADGCLATELFVLVEYDLAGYVGTESTSLPLFVTAVQCRNGDPTVDPFDDATVPECEPGYDCTCDWLIGKVEVDDPLVVGRTYDFDEGLSNYAIRVTDTDGTDGVAFELVTTDGSAPLPLSSVLVKGGPDEQRYSRRDGFGFETTDLDGATAGLVYPPLHPNNGSQPAISYVVVGVCVPTDATGDCPEDLVQSAASVDNSGRGGRR
ncbi:hypothetical protein IL252_07415 [Halomicrobium sp. IBSBa]|uniref:hypothetical protein n=1 Tax=Halomicrobium sp. IBSBa TaxID=2778916 RepID=UPI001ABEE931|nr:hypothetical protein [Halomicrobium sp. IBSBa]MBO4247643.1 hypothetical protein [Halomicrobium sp. IBSBa]